MAFRLVASVKRSGSTQAYFQQRIPTAVLPRAVGLTLDVPVGAEVVPVRITARTTTIRLSLRTSEPSLAKVRQAEVAAFFETVWQSLRSTKPVSLTHRQCVALAGELFRAWTAEGGRTLEVELQHDGTWAVVEDNFIPPEGWQAALDHLEALGDDIEPETLAPSFGPLIRKVLLRRGIGDVDTASWAMLLREFRKALRDAFVVQQRQASGDYAPAKEQARFPPLEPVERGEDRQRDSAAAAPKLSLTGLVDGWWAEAKPAGRTVKTEETYRAIFKRFSTFLGHDDARAVRAEAAHRHRLVRGGMSICNAARFQWTISSSNICMSLARSFFSGRGRGSRSSC